MQDGTLSSIHHQIHIDTFVLDTQQIQTVNWPNFKYSVLYTMMSQFQTSTAIPLAQLPSQMDSINTLSTMSLSIGLIKHLLLIVFLLLLEMSLEDTTLPYQDHT